MNNDRLNSIANAISNALGNPSNRSMGMFNRLSKLNDSSRSGIEDVSYESRI